MSPEEVATVDTVMSGQIITIETEAADAFFQPGEFRAVSGRSRFQLLYILRKVSHIFEKLSNIYGLLDHCRAA